MARNALSEKWMDEANCVGTDPEAWFPGKGGRLTGIQRRVCDACPVIDLCLDYALANKLRGIWGGTTEVQRRTLRKTTVT